jgi:hypothetical protein
MKLLSPDFFYNLENANLEKIFLNFLHTDLLKKVLMEFRIFHGTRINLIDD